VHSETEFSFINAILSPYFEMQKTLGNEIRQLYDTQEFLNNTTYPIFSFAHLQTTTVHQVYKQRVSIGFTLVAVLEE
jgi:hypothetical protein